MAIGKASFDDDETARQLHRGDRGDRPRQAVLGQGQIHPLGTLTTTMGPGIRVDTGEGRRPRGRSAPRSRSRAQDHRSRSPRPPKLRSPLPETTGGGQQARKPGAGETMNREEKSATIQEIAAQIEGAEAIFAVDYRGISVPQAAELRAKLREADASFRIVKNRLTKLAADASRRGAPRRAAAGPDRADLRPRRHRPGRESDLDLQQRARRPHLQGRLHGRRPRSTRKASRRSPTARPRSPDRPVRRRRRQPR